MGTPESIYKNGDVIYVSIPSRYMPYVDRGPEFDDMYKAVVYDTATSYAHAQIIYGDDSFGPRIPLYDLIGKSEIIKSPEPGPGPEPEPGAKVIDQTGILTQLFINADASDEELAEVVRKGLETWGSSSESMYILFSTISDFTQEQPGEGDVFVMAGCEESSGSEGGGTVDIFFINYGTQEFYQYTIAYNYENRTGVYDSNTSSPTAGQKMSGIIALPAIAGSYQGVVVTSASENPPAAWSEHPEVIVPVVSFNENPWVEESGN